MTRIKGLAVLAPSQLDAMATKELLSRLQRLRACEESAARSDWSPEEVEAAGGSGDIYFKDDPRWQVEYDHLHAVLNTREHVPRRLECEAARVERAKTSRRAARPRPRRIGPA